MVNIFADTFLILFSSDPKEFRKFDASNATLFQIKVFGKNVKDTTLGSYFAKVTTHHSFARLILIKQISKVQ